MIVLDQPKSSFFKIFVDFLLIDQLGPYNVAVSSNSHRGFHRTKALATAGPGYLRAFYRQLVEIFNRRPDAYRIEG